MYHYRVTAVAGLLAHYRSTETFKWSRATLRAISAFLLDGEVHGEEDNILKIVNPSQRRPVIVFIHEDWTNRDAQYFRILRAAAMATGLPFALACIDLALPANRGWLAALRTAFQDSSVPLELPLAHIRMRDRTESLNLSPPKEIPRAVAARLHHAAEKC
jgi:hypothetical protein